MTPDRWREVEQLYHAALEHSAAERPHFLEEACAGDNALLREVESLLAFDQDSEQSGESFGNDIAPELLTDQAAPLAEGRILGSYRIISRLGQGGMGEVYLAQDLREANLQRKVALKVLRQTSITVPEEALRFRQEAYAASALNHPNIAAVFEIGVQQDQHFIAMEFVEGQTLQQRMQSGPISLREALHIAIQLAGAIAAAHDAGIVHRDMKPANIMLRTDGYIKIVDFGVAKLMAPGTRGTDPTASDWQVCTNPGWAIGTPRYMAPEQTLAQAPDGRCDIYSLGIVLYELIAGRVPFEESYLGNLMAALTQEPPSLRVHAPTAPAELERVVGKAIARDREQRYGSARQLLADLKNLQLDLEIGLRDTGKRARMVVIAAVTLMITASAFWLELIRKPAPPMPERASIAVLPFVDMSEEQNQEYFCDGLAEELLNSLANTPRLRVTGRTSSFQFKGKSEDFAVIGKRLNAAAILEGSVRKQGTRAKITVQLIKAADGSHLWSETYDRDLNDIFAVQEEIARSVTGALKVTLLGARPAGKSTTAKAYNAYLQGRFFFERQNHANLNKAASYFEDAIQIDPGYAPAWVGLGETRIVQASQGDIAEEEGFRKAREQVERALALDAGLAEAHSAMGQIKLLHDWDWTAADASFQRALALEPGNAVMVSFAGTLARVLGRLDEAIALYRQAIQIDPLNPRLYRGLGSAFYYAGRQEEAATILTKALDLFREMANLHCLLGLVYLAQGRPQAALAEMEQETDPALRLYGLALAIHGLGHKQEAASNLATLIATFQNTASYQIAEVYAVFGQTGPAFEWLERAYQERDAGLTQTKGDPLLESLERDPRYPTFLQKMRLPR